MIQQKTSGEKTQRVEKNAGLCYNDIRENAIRPAFCGRKPEGVTRGVKKKDIERYEPEIAALEAQEMTPGGVVFYGSSTISHWPREQMERELQPYHVTARGFGGSTAEEAFFFYPRLVRPCAPEVLALYVGDNDPLAGYPPDRAYVFTERLLRTARTDFPGIRLLLIGVKYSEGQRDANAMRRDYNRYLRRYASQRTFAQYVDLPGLVHNQYGDPRPDCYEADGVHLNAHAYSMLAESVKKALEALKNAEKRRRA